MKTSFATDWARVDAMTDDEIVASDIPPLDAGFFTRARLVAPPGKPPMLIAVDPETRAWFESRGPDLDASVAEALESYMHLRSRDAGRGEANTRVMRATRPAARGSPRDARGPIPPANARTGTRGPRKTQAPHRRARARFRLRDTRTVHPCGGPGIRPAREGRRLELMQVVNVRESR